MGRSKTKAKQKSNVPIVFPHDGPVFHLCCGDNCEDNEHGQDAFLKSAIKALGASKNTGDSGAHSEVYLLITSLFQILQRPNTTTKEQLQALQTFKCSFINLEKQIAEGNKIRGDEDWNVVVALYRVLLEWSLSYRTPLPFQRAIQANLKMLGLSAFSLARATNKVDDPETICKDVIESIWKSSENWEDPLYSLDIAVNYAPLREILQKNLITDCLTFLGRTQTVSAVLEERQGLSLSSQLIENALRIVTMLKILFGNWDANMENPPGTMMFEKFVFALLTYPKLPSDGFNTLGILYGKLLFLNIDPETDTTAMVQKCITTVAGVDSLSPLARLSMVQGIAATIDADFLIKAEKDSPLELCWEYSLRVGQTSTDPMVRWAAIKGLSTLASRWKQQQPKIGNTDDQHQQEPLLHMALVKKTLDLVFDSWENPPLRKLGMAIPGLFKALVQLLPRSDLRGLCQQVLEQPASRKGRYLALEILLPYMPTKSIQKDSTIPSSSGMTIPIESLLEGIGDRGANAGSIANLLIKVLKCAWQELTSQVNIVDEFNNDCFESWKNYWMPSFCRAILDPSLTRRKQVVAFCLPRIADLMKEFNNLKDQLPLLFVGLLEGIEEIAEKNLHSDTFDYISDRVLWAELEITRYSSTIKLSDGRMDQIVANCLPRERFRFALVHSLPFVRIVAFRAMKCVVSSYGTTRELEEEAEMWRYALPYSIKTNESKEYLSNLLQCLSNFLDRLAAWEAGTNDDSGCGNLPIFQSFAIGFLIDDVILAKGSYSGTIADKEIFGVSLLGCLLAFSLQNESYGGDNTILKKNAVFNRKRSPKEETAMNEILKALLRRDVLSSLFGLLHSIWDNTRAVTFQYLTKIAVASQLRKLALANEYCDANQRRSILVRGIYLASSPRQRESDTGARMICFLYASLPEQFEKDLFLSEVVDLSRDRVSSMKRTLNNIILGNSASISGSCLPLAHGLVHAIRLCIDHDKSARRLLSITSNRGNVRLNESMIEVFCNALQLSLSVVADVRDGEAIDGIDEEALLVTGETKESDSTPLNVNTGAIGANGTFSSVSATDMEEAKARLAMQRVVVGSWLLTKETCAAIASVITTEGYTATHLLVSKVGQLLLSTLTTLKHAGAAFAARDALQLIATNCLNPKNPSEIRSLPDAWSHRLIDEISLNEKVRNSTLRRSTGYALGFLAIMRADVGNKCASSIVSIPLLQKLLMLSLPPEQRIEESLEKLKIFENQADRRKFFVYASNSNMNQPYILDSQYEARCRVHALNVLRMIILDAPLASVISPLVGDTIISAILGYDDPSWAIRNSSTMVFAAAMLRVIDPDKNASNSDKTSSNAITLTELFRRYPPLATFIPSVLRLCLEEMECEGNVKSEMFPILLMLSRVQPVMDSATTISGEFIPLLFRCLGSKDYGIRHAAARSLANLSSKAIASTLLSECKQHINLIPSDASRDWNLIDGVLLAMDSLGLSSNTELLDIEAQTNLIGIANSINIPPSCRSTALGILLVSTFVDNGAVRCACDNIAKNDKVQFMIGGSLLYRTASEALCLMSQENLWQATSESIVENGLSQLKHLFVNDIVDVRLYSVKRFKKDIYRNLDRLCTRNTNGMTQLSPMIILNGLATMLLDCVGAELGRGIADSTGSHIPTLRRLSRCLLETLNAIPKSSLLPTNHELMWSISYEITEREYTFLAKGGPCSSTINYLDSNGGNVLSSNAVEMMALAIAMEYGALVVNRNGLETCHIYEKMKILLKAVGTLNDPNGSWRSRYSAALALEICCNVLVVEEDNTEKEILLRKVMITILEMLQDSDPDVRTVAVRVATKFYAKKNEQSISSSAHVILLPEWTLEMTFPLTFTVDSSSRYRKTQKSAIMELLQAMILDHCRGLIEIMQNLQDEFSNTDQYFTVNGVGKVDDDVSKLKALVNANTTRKIFEDEDPNPFQEKILLNQLAVRSLLSFASHPETASSFQLPDNTRDVLTMCDSVLMRLLKTQNDGGMVHEISRYPTIFPSLHSILCASATALHMVGPGKTKSKPMMCIYDGHLSILKQLREKIQISAERLISMDKDHSFLHPSILCALHALNFTDYTDSVYRPTKSEIEELLFLLKPNE